jgi:hypothetical protein
MQKRKLIRILTDDTLHNWAAARLFKGTVAPDQIVLKVVWLDRP